MNPYEESLQRQRYYEEELINTITSALGIIVGMVAIPVLLAYAVYHGTELHVWGAAIFSLALLLVYASSTLFHGVRNRKVKDVLRTIDHMTIYLLIAGTYTPFLLVYLPSETRWTWLAILWGMALVGVGFKLFYTGRYELLSVGYYLLMGWMLVFIGKPLTSAIPDHGLWWLVAGGLSYSAGVIFYRLDHIRYTHAVWHIFALAGTGSHYISVFYTIEAYQLVAMSGACG
ncbi:PAQR family membrane homeostasis protein TrhA [Pontibacter sp. G13]|uniref:PAQR family membrane homeostasis protein TrhA n=1 Tax=Pontibacter sp. G13 TaxID=3074898 RepID=UPI002889A3FC|nr:hemolysin III family protein [Pontibacter sp. G13]WNJ17405.1 hemolysin III family protein [Pontibacter sp. G13]